MKEVRPVLCVVAGPNGSGKTSTTEKLLANEWAADDNSREGLLPTLLYRTVEGKVYKRYVDNIAIWAQSLV